MYTRVPVHIVDCSGFMGTINILTQRVSYVDMNKLACAVYMWHLGSIYVFFFIYMAIT